MMKLKLLVISRCADCNVEGCENRVCAGSIPEGCGLEDALADTQDTSLLALKCLECRCMFEQIPMERQYCPICGTANVEKREAEYGISS